MSTDLQILYESLGLDDEEMDRFIQITSEPTLPPLLLEGAWWDKYVRKPLTRDENAKLKVPKKNLQCTVMRFETKSGELVGYAGYTHRASTGFYSSPDKIPASKLEFVSSTS